VSRVELARRARKEIVDLDWLLSDAVVEALGLLEREAEADHLLRGRRQGLRSLRVGTYRIIHKLTTISA
jgi:mRNA-degrading endonuclease RelE of RelBE toxin-antitoxin system